MVGINKLTIAYGDRYLFKEVSFLIGKKDNIGLVGKNGAGKSSLLKIIAKEQKNYKGEVSYPKDFNIGYLAQDLEFDNSKSLIEHVKTVFGEATDINKKIADINIALTEREDYESDSYLDLIHQLSDLTEKQVLLEQENNEAKIEQILFGLGFLKSDFEKNTGTFSGGWRMRIELAKILLSPTQLLLLDEPTNHLDIESIKWLETFLKQYKGATLIISHDKMFLDNITNKTLEISLGKFYEYKGNYSYYLKMRAERKESLVQTYKNQQKLIKQTEDFIDKFRYKASKANQVQSRVKQLEKLDRVEIEDEESTIRFKFQPAPHSGKVTTELIDVSKNYDEKLIFEPTSLFIERGEKVAFVGKNGEGKSTMIKAITNTVDYKGEVKLGHQVKVGYYAQNQADELDQKKTIFETIDEVAEGEIRTKIRALLGAFLFKDDEIDKYISVLSGGERAKVALCKLLLTPYNFLVLDEPTNHLDIASKNILKQALKDYNGSLVIVSHDRDFLFGLVNQMYEFKNKKVKHYTGSIEDYLKSVKPVEQSLKKESSSSKKRIPKKEVKLKARENSKKISQVETKIGKLEKEIEILNEEISKAYSPSVLEEYEKKKQALNLLMKEWESLNE